MFTPKYPTPDQATTAPVPVVTTLGTPDTPAPVVQAPVPVAAPGAVRPSPRVSPSSAGLAVAGGAAGVLIVGAVLVSLLLAIAITAASVAVCAVVLRSLLTNHR